LERPLCLGILIRLILQRAQIPPALLPLRLDFERTLSITDRLGVLSAFGFGCCGKLQLRKTRVCCRLTLSRRLRGKTCRLQLLAASTREPPAMSFGIAAKTSSTDAPFACKFRADFPIQYPVCRGSAFLSARAALPMLILVYIFGISALALLTGHRRPNEAADRQAWDKALPSYAPPQSGHCRRRIAACPSPLLFGANAPTLPTFEEIPPSLSGISWTHTAGKSPAKHLPETSGPGCAFVDYDNDGWISIL
jgi:hypothetical protein